MSVMGVVLDEKDKTATVVFPLYEHGTADSARSDDASVASTTMAHVMAQLLSAVHEVHRRDIVHGDLSPTNILIASDGSFVVTDFGCSFDVQLVATQTAAYTQKYCPPEFDTTNPKSRKRLSYDVWALGRVFLFIGHKFFGWKLVEEGVKVRAEDVGDSPVVARVLGGMLAAVEERITVLAALEDLATGGAAACGGRAFPGCPL